MIWIRNTKVELVKAAASSCTLRLRQSRLRHRLMTLLIKVGRRQRRHCRISQRRGRRVVQMLINGQATPMIRAIFRRGAIEIGHLGLDLCITIDWIRVLVLGQVVAVVVGVHFREAVAPDMMTVRLQCMLVVV